MIIVVASGVGRAKCLAAELALARADIVACSPLSIRNGAGRGLVADMALIDETAWPLGKTETEVLQAAVRNGRIYRMERVLAKGQRP